VGIGVRVIEYSGEVVEMLATGYDVEPVREAAASDPGRYPLLAGIDEYDDTTFNARQAKVLITELTSLAATEELAGTATQLITLAELLLPAPGRPHHRHLVFVGD
jgi:hypothetical protein